MATVAAYRKALERLYTLIGKEFGLLVVAVNPTVSGSAAPARELVLVARSISNEGAPVSGIRQIIRGPVLRIDLNTEGTTGSHADKEHKLHDVVVLKPSDIKAALDGRSFPPGTPFMIALVGVGTETITRFSDCTCAERPDLIQVASGGYLVLSYTLPEEAASEIQPSSSTTASSMRLSWMELCEKPKTKTRATGCVVKEEPKFLVGVEKLDDKRSITYAIRVQPMPDKIEAPTPPPRVSRVEPPIPTKVEPMRAIRAPRWQRVVEASAIPGWEHLVQATVERELSKMLTIKSGKTEQNAYQLGDGLLARVWPDLIYNISKDRDWTSVFTHQSVNPTPRANYESLETLGDKVLGVCLVHYLFANGKTIDSNGFTDSLKEILSHKRQSEMSVSMGFNSPGLIRSSVTVGPEILEDVYEAFFGCLFTVTNRLVDGGNQGLPLCELMFRRILHETFPELDPWSVPKDPQTTLDQIFIRMEWGHPIVSYNEETRVTTIRLTRDAYAYLESMGPAFPRDRPLAIGPKAEDKSASARAAAEIALNVLKTNWGITTRYASLVVRSRLMRDERYAVVQREALAVAERMGYSDVYVLRKAKNHNQLYAVMGVKPDDTETQLHIYKYETGKNLGGGEDMSTRVAAYITALREFIASRNPQGSPA